MSEMPVFQNTMNPMLEVLRASADALPIDELDRRVMERMALPADVLAVPHDPDKPDRSEIAYRIAWARTWLKKAGLVHNPKRGEWTVTDKGRGAGHVDADGVVSEVSRMYREQQADKPDGDKGQEADDQVELDVSADEATAPRVGSILAKELKQAYEKLGADGALPTREQIRTMLQRFREGFGPDKLAGLDGVALLTRMHGRGTKDSLVHWLEFKDDDELGTYIFGSIAGGSALKFGIYQSIETEAWMTGPPKQQVRLEVDGAVERARTQRDELVAAAKLLSTMGTAEHVDYDALQDELMSVAPTTADTAWGHKVLAMWFPDLLDPFHVTAHQAHHLRRLLKLAEPGRYANAGLFAGIARQLGMTLLELAQVLVARNGGPYATWRIGTRIDGASLWSAMRDGGFAAVGWDGLGDLSEIEASKKGKETIRALLEQHYPNVANVLSKSANQIYNFVRGAQERDLVVAMDGTQVLGVGRITGPYEHVAGEIAPHRRRVAWELSGPSWKLPQTEGLLTTFVQLQKHPLNLIEVEARLLGKSVAPRPPPTKPPPKPVEGSVPPPEVAPPPPGPLEKTVARIDAVLTRKRQVILYGPPGTGKTHWATTGAREIVARAWFERAWSTLSDSQSAELTQAGAIELISFHPAYGYEDFLEGYRPADKGAFELRDGVFKRLCARAATDRRRPYILIIDEINRGDLPRIFGELLTVIERDKRGRPITLPLSGAKLEVPDNVFLIGTMNTADRSIALLDAALRRRFGFIELTPDTSLFKGIRVDKVPLEAWLDALNDKILQHAGRDARNLRVGHAYFMQGGQPIREIGRFAEILRDDVIPLLEEICYEDFDALERILGGRIVLRQKKRIDIALFEPDRYDALQDAILQAFPGLTTTKAAAEAEVEAESEADEGVEEPGEIDDEETS